jgi:hypothetical protein
MNFVSAFSLLTFVIPTPTTKTLTFGAIVLVMYFKIRESTTQRLKTLSPQATTLSKTQLRTLDYKHLKGMTQRLRQ